MKVAITGASGLIGSALVPPLRSDGHEVHRLVRGPAHRPDEISWDPAAARLDPAALAGIDAVVHLAAASIGGRRWSSAYKTQLRRSRIDGTRTVAAAIAAATPPPPVLLSASAVGYYGDTGDQIVDESAPPGRGFLADLCVEWEAATAPARHAGTRVAHLRSGIVLSGHGGLLGRVLPLFRLGLGGRLGTGRQYLSWISLPDEIAAIRFLLTADEIAGPVNLTAPEPVTNAAYTAAIGRALHRPTPVAVPAMALRVVLDGLADEGILVGQRVLPGVLESAGFAFAHRGVDTALAAVLRRVG